MAVGSESLELTLMVWQPEGEALGTDLASCGNREVSD